MVDARVLVLLQTRKLFLAHIDHDCDYSIYLSKDTICGGWTSKNGEVRYIVVVSDSRMFFVLGRPCCRDAFRARNSFIHASSSGQRHFNGSPFNVPPVPIRYILYAPSSGNSTKTANILRSCRLQTACTHYWYRHYGSAASGRKIPGMSSNYNILNRRTHPAPVSTYHSRLYSMAFHIKIVRFLEYHMLEWQWQ